MKRACMLAVVLTFAATVLRAAAPTITIDASTPAGKVSPLLYGLMTEEINHAYDGGLYAELIRNRAFLDDAASPAHWSAVHGDGAAAAIALDTAQPLNATIGDQPAPRGDAGLSRARRRRRQRGLLGHPGQAEHPLSRVLLREGGAGLHRPDHRRDRE